MQTSSLATTVLAALLVCTANAATTPRRRVETLPGYGAPPTPTYSGFVEVNPATSTHAYYYLIESETSPETAPLVLWQNGGPGASTVAAHFTLNGPLLYNGTGFTRNPFAWNRQANVLLIDFPPGVGYSYCANSSTGSADCQQESDMCSPCSASDSSVAEQSAALLHALLADASLFPELAGRALYIAGESYAGVYAPTLALELLRTHADVSLVNLHGVWVIDPCTDNQAQFGWLDMSVEFAWQRGWIDERTRSTLVSSDCSSGRTAVGDYLAVEDTRECRAAWRLYDLATAGLGNAVHPVPPHGLPMYIDPLYALGPSGGVDTGAYLNRTDVRAALNAEQSPNVHYHAELDNNGYAQYASSTAPFPHSSLSTALSP